MGRVIAFEMSSQNKKEEEIGMDEGIISQIEREYASG